jgi:hypothetical protein
MLGRMPGVCKHHDSRLQSSSDTSCSKSGNVVSGSVEASRCLLTLLQVQSRKSWGDGSTFGPVGNRMQELH